MTSEKLCPFDKEPCIRDACAVWSSDKGVCAFALIPAALSGVKPAPRSEQKRERSSSSGLSGRFKDPLFD